MRLCGLSQVTILTWVSAYSYIKSLFPSSSSSSSSFFSLSLCVSVSLSPPLSESQILNNAPDISEAEMKTLKASRQRTVLTILLTFCMSPLLVYKSVKSKHYALLLYIPVHPPTNIVSNTKWRFDLCLLKQVAELGHSS